MGQVQRAAKLLGRKGGKNGGPARAVVLSKQRQIDIAREGGKARALKAGKMPKP